MRKIPGTPPTPRPTATDRARGSGLPDLLRMLGVSRATAHVHVENAKRRLGAVSRAQAVALNARLIGPS